MLNVATIASHVRNELRDNFANLKSYSDSEIILYVNAALSWLPSVDSTANIVTEPIDLVDGIIQRIPNGGVRLVDVFANASGASVRERIDGRAYSGNSAVREISQSQLARSFPHWANARHGTIVVHTMFNKTDPTSFIVYPPNNGNGKVIACYAKEIPQVTGETIDQQGIDIAEKYMMVIVHYVIFRALSRDGEDQSSASRAMTALENSLKMLQAPKAQDLADTPADGAKQ